MFDGDPLDGMGHRRRCEAISKVLSAAGAIHAILPTGGGMRSTASGVILIDSYRYRADDCRQFAAPVVAAIDDCLRDLRVDIVVDPAPGATGTEHPNVRMSLAGGEYAIVDPGIRLMQPTQIRGSVKSVVVATGGSDPSGYGARIARELRSVLDRDTALRLVLGPASSDPHIDGTTVVRVSDGLADDLAAADLVVTAAGVTLLEALALGRPTVAVSLYENQRRQAHGVGQRGGALVAGLDEVAGVVRALAVDEQLRMALSERARRLVDGRGAERVAEALLARL